MSVTRIGFLTLMTVGICLGADDSVSQARQLEVKGDALGARAALERAARGPSAETGALVAYAEFLDRRKEPGARPYGAIFHSTGKCVWVCPVGVGVGSMLKVRVSLSLLP